MLHNSPQQYLQIKPLICLLVIVIPTVFFAGCDSGGGRNANTGGNSSIVTTNTNASGTPQVGDDENFRGLDDRPILITGGTVYLDFDHLDYCGSNGTYTSTNNLVTAMMILDDNDQDKLVNPINCSSSSPDCRFPANGKFTIRIICKQSGPDREISIHSVPGSTATRDTVTITFEEADLPRRRKTTASRRHFGKKLKIDDVIVKDDNPGGTEFSLQKKNRLPPNGKATIEIGGRRP